MMVCSIFLCACAGLLFWFAGWLYVLHDKYHKVRPLIRPRILFQKKKLLAIVLYAALGAAAGAMFCLHGWTATKILRYLLILYGTLLIAYVDSYSRRIPNEILLVLWSARAALLIAELCLHMDSASLILASAFGGMFIGFVIFLLAYLASKKSVGMGDVKLIAVVGFYTGTATLYGIMLLALLCCFLYSGFQMLRHRLTIKDFVPFGPFVALGTALALLIGL